MTNWLKIHITMTDIRSVLLLLAGVAFLFMLPDAMIGPYALFNPYKTWLMTLIIAGISFVGYLAIRIFGSRNGVILTGALGGLISSTAVAISLSGIAKEHPSQIKTFASGVIMACTLMFLRVLVEASIIDMTLAWKLLPLYLLAAILGAGYGLFLYRGSEHFEIDATATDFMRHPLQISTSLKFGLLFGLIYGMIHLVADHYGDIGVYVVAALSGVTDVDAITLSLATTAQEHNVHLFVALWGITIASLVNTFAKTIIVYWVSGIAMGNMLLRYSLISMMGMAIGAVVIVGILGA